MGLYDAYKAQYQPIANAAADKYGVPRNIFSALIEKESGWNPYAYGDGGAAYGFGQLHDAAARDVGVSKYDPTSNLYGSAAYLASQPGAATGDWATALASYNQGAAGYAGAGRSAGDAYAADVLGRAGATGGSSGFSVQDAGNLSEADIAAMGQGGATAAAGASDAVESGNGSGAIAQAITGAGEKISGALGGAGDAIAAPFKAVSEFFATVAKAFTGDFWNSAWAWIRDKFLILAMLLLALIFLFAGGAKLLNSGAQA